MNWLKLGVLSALALVLATKAQAQIVDLPQEELAKESVLPVFDRPVNVRNRNIVTDGRVDVNLFYGLALSEPIYNVSRYGLSGYYNTSEKHAFGLIYLKSSTGLSMYAEQLREPKFYLDFTRAPSPDQSIFLDWNWKLFYGKMSITKQAVFNTSLYTSVMAGMVNFSHKSYPGVAAGLGQKFYFTNHLAFRFDLRMVMNQAPIPFLDGALKVGVPQPGGGTKDDPVPTAGQFKERMTYTTVLDAGLTYLF